MVKEDDGDAVVLLVGNDDDDDDDDSPPTVADVWVVIMAKVYKVRTVDEGGTVSDNSWTMSCNTVRWEAARAA